MKIHFLGLAIILMFADVRQSQDELSISPDIKDVDNDPFAEEFLEAFMGSPLVLD